MNNTEEEEEEDKQTNNQISLSYFMLTFIFHSSM